MKINTLSLFSLTHFTANIHICNLITDVVNDILFKYCWNMAKRIFDFIFQSLINMLIEEIKNKSTVTVIAAVLQSKIFGMYFLHGYAALRPNKLSIICKHGQKLMWC